jgi:hypothetical protein
MQRWSMEESQHVHDDLIYLMQLEVMQIIILHKKVVHMIIII